MTRTQTRAYGVIAPSSRQLLLEAMLCVFACLVSNVVSKFRTIFSRRNRDWHTDAAGEDLLPTPNDITQKAPQRSQPSFSGNAEGRIPRIPVTSTQGTTPYSLATDNQDARHKTEHDSAGAAKLRTTLSPSFRAKAHRAADPEPRGDARRHHDAQILGSRFRGNDNASVFERERTLSLI